MDVSQLGKFIVVAGIALVALGAIIMLVGRIPFLGNLPGDIHYRRGNTSIYIPITTMILVSLILTIVLNLIFRR